MHSRLDSHALAPDLTRHAIALQQSIEALAGDPRLLELVKIRASQINGCAYCLHMHTADARRLGESDVRMHLLAGWRESTLFTPRERAVLAWTEAVSQVAERAAPDALYADLQAHLSPTEIVAVTAAVAMINYWNRMAIATGAVHPAERGHPA